MPSFDLLTVLLIVSFLVYGTRCLLADAMVHEFKRWGVPRLRYTTGLLEMLGSLGLLIGQWFPLLAFFSAAGLSLLMLCGLCVRIRVRDSFTQTLPAVFFLAVSAIVAYRIGIAW